MGRRAQGAPRLSWAGDGTWPRDWTSRVCPSRVRIFPASLRPGPLEAGQGPGDHPPGRPPHTRWLPGLQPRLFKWKRLFPPRTKGAGHLCATVVPALARSRVTGGGRVEVPGLRGPGRPSPDTASPPSPPQLCSARPPPSRAVGPCARPARPAPSAGTGTTALRGPWEVPGPGATSTSRFSPRAGPSARWAAETPATMFRKSFQRPGKTMILCRGRKVRKPNLRDRVAEGDPSCKRRGCRAPRRARPRRTALLVARDCGPRSLFPAPCVVSVTSRIT